MTREDKVENTVMKIKAVLLKASMLGHAGRVIIAVPFNQGHITDQAIKPDIEMEIE